MLKNKQLCRIQTLLIISTDHSRFSLPALSFSRFRCLLSILARIIHVAAFFRSDCLSLFSSLFTTLTVYSERLAFRLHFYCNNITRLIINTCVLYNLIRTYTLSPLLIFYDHSSSGRKLLFLNFLVHIYKYLCIKISNSYSIYVVNVSRSIRKTTSITVCQLTC